MLRNPFPGTHHTLPSHPTTTRSHPDRKVAAPTEASSIAIGKGATCRVERPDPGAARNRLESAGSSLARGVLNPVITERVRQPPQPPTLRPREGLLPPLDPSRGFFCPSRLPPRGLTPLEGKSADTWRAWRDPRPRPAHRSDGGSQLGFSPQSRSLQIRAHLDLEALRILDEVCPYLVRSTAHRAVFDVRHVEPATHVRRRIHHVPAVRAAVRDRIPISSMPPFHGEIVAPRRAREASPETSRVARGKGALRKPPQKDQSSAERLIWG